MQMLNIPKPDDVDHIPYMKKYTKIYQNQLLNFKKGGNFLTREEIIQQQTNAIVSYKQLKSKIQESDGNINDTITTQECIISKLNLCKTDEDKLEQIIIKDLKVGEIIPNSILWVVNICQVHKMSSLMLAVEDFQKNACNIFLYNQTPSNTKFEQIQEIFPIGVYIGIKQPHLKIMANGNISLRNDNHQNIIIQYQGLDHIDNDVGQKALNFKERGNKFFGENNFIKAVQFYKNGLQCVENNFYLKITLLANIAQSYLELHLYEDCLIYADQALVIDGYHQKSLYRKAQALLYLQEYDESLEIFQQLSMRDRSFLKDIERAQELEKQSQGDFTSFYESLRKNQDLLVYIQNYINGIYIEFSLGMGRGLYAMRHIKKGELLIAEKAIAFTKENKSNRLFSLNFIDKNVIDGAQVELTQECQRLIQLKGVSALRMQYLYDGTEQKIPDINIFIFNKYKNHIIDDMNLEKIQQICRMNSFSNTIREKYNTLYGMTSLINHSKNYNALQHQALPRQFSFVHATKDIKKGEQIFFDYINDDSIQGDQRKKILKKWGIQEE